MSTTLPTQTLTYRNSHSRTYLPHQRNYLSTYLPIQPPTYLRAYQTTHLRSYQTTYLPNQMSKKTNSDCHFFPKVEADLHNKLTTEHIPVSLLSSRLATALSQLSHASQPQVTRPSRVSHTTITCTTSSSKRRAPKPEKTRTAFPAKPSLR